MVMITVINHADDDFFLSSSCNELLKHVSKSWIKCTTAGGQNFPLELFKTGGPIRRKLDDSFSWVDKKTCKANFITYVLTQITITICIFGAIYMTKFTSSIDRGTWPTNILMASGSGVGGSGSTAALLIMERFPWLALLTTSIISKGEKAFVAIHSTTILCLSFSYLILPFKFCMWNILFLYLLILNILFQFAISLNLSEKKKFAVNIFHIDNQPAHVQRGVWAPERQPPISKTNIWNELTKKKTIKKCREDYHQLKIF